MKLEEMIKQSDSVSFLSANKTVVWVNGTFDVLHRGHIELFKQAKSLGDFLIVGTDTDRRITQLKGKNRPINTLENREAMLRAIRYIDIVTHYDSDEELRECIKMCSANIMVIGEDYRDKWIIGADLFDKIIYVERFGGLSSTNIINSKN